MVETVSKSTSTAPACVDFEEFMKSDGEAIIRSIIARYGKGIDWEEAYQELQIELGVSRTPIREAIITLETERLVKILPKKGILVTDITMNDVNSIFEVRTLLESYAIEKLGVNVAKEKLLEFLWYYQAYNRERNCSNAEFFEKDGEFHMLFMSLVDNPYMKYTYETISSQNNRLRVMSGLKEHRLMETSDEHIAIIKACLEEDFEKAANAMKVHLANAKSAIFNYLFYKKHE